MPLTLQVTESGGFDLHDAEEWYDGSIAAIEETDGQWGPGLKFIIHLDGDTDPINDEPRETWAFASQKLSPRSKLYQWLKGINGDAPAPGDHIDMEDLVNRRVQVMFERYDGRDVDGNPQEKEKVVKLRKGKGEAPKAEPKPKTTEPDDSPF